MQLQGQKKAVSKGGGPESLVPVSTWGVAEWGMVAAS